MPRRRVVGQPPTASCPSTCVAEPVDLAPSPGPLTFESGRASTVERITYRIAEAADAVGVPATTLRYYEDIGLMPAPGRGPDGYRVYADTDLVRLRFITAAKNLGIPLADVKALAAAFDVDDCSSVAHQMVELVALRLSETRTRISELKGTRRPAARRLGSPLCDAGRRGVRGRLSVQHGEDRNRATGPGRSSR